MSANRTQKRGQQHSDRKPKFTAPQRPQDDADIDEWVEKAKNLPDLRWEKVQQIRQALASGEYDVDERMETILQNMSNAFGGKSDK
jgi:anti-sigma28 factor (negative regulator of flagellin synthesis)